MNDTISTILSRRSVRNYAEEQLDENQIMQILDAGNNAPCSSKELHFSILESTAIMDAISEKIREAMSKHERFAQIAAQSGFDPLYGAPVLIIVSGPSKHHVTHDDCVSAVTTMTIAATSMGLGSCFMGLVGYALRGEESKSLAQSVGIPDGYEAHAGIIVGYAAGAVEQAKRKADKPSWIR